MAQRRILVTGGTGNIGRKVTQQLAKTGHEVVVATRNPHATDEVSHVALDFTNPETFAAVEGCDALFLLRPPVISNTKATLNVLIDHAIAAGVEHIVFVSVAGAEANRLVPHHAVEQHLMQSGVAYTILRPGFFCQNLETAYRDDILHDDRIYLPAGDGEVAFIDTRDIGEVAANCLLAPEHYNKAYLLTGQETLTFYEVAALLTEELGHTIVYQPASVAGYVWHLWKQNVRGVQAIVYTILHVGLRRGDAEQVDPTLRRLLGREPTSMREYIHDYRELWEKSGFPPSPRRCSGQVRE